jgi:hypothetical protein
MPPVHRVMIVCPVRNVPIFTGIAMSSDAFETATLVDNVVGNCHLCGLSHKWNKKDSFLEGDEPRPTSSDLGGHPPLTRSGSHP